MSTKPKNGNERQIIFREMVLGTLVYSVVLGFFSDYTSILHTESYSVTFAVAVVLQIFTYLTLELKNKVVAHYRGQAGSLNKPGLIINVWLIMFLSKFVFLEVITIIFGDAVDVDGFVGLLVVILVMTLLKQLIDYIYSKLTDE